MGGAGAGGDYHLAIGPPRFSTLRIGGRESGPRIYESAEPGDEEEVLPTKINTSLKQGDVFRHISPGGGGYGNPLERDPRAVWWDWRNGKVTAGHAREAYGVVINEASREVDKDATAALRRERG